MDGEWTEHMWEMNAAKSILCKEWTLQRIDSAKNGLSEEWAEQGMNWVLGEMHRGRDARVLPVDGETYPTESKGVNFTFG